MFLSRERPDVRALLTWAEAQSKDGLEANLVAHSVQLGVEDLASVEYALHDGIKVIVVDGLLNRARNCVGRGCELWRSLVAEWSGDSAQVRDAKARKFLDPRKCKDTAELWAVLAAWERLGEEVVTSGLSLPEWMRNTALEKLLPVQLLSTLVARSELREYSARLAWVKAQMEHSRGVAQAAAYGPGTGKDKDGDVYMNSVEAEPSDGLAWALANAVEQGDWAQQEALQIAILAVKGGGKGGFRKGLGKGKPGPGAAAADGKGGSAGAGFNGACNHCGIWGHRRSECRKLTAELGKKGGAKGDKGAGKGGKGGPKGGKGPPTDPLLECAAGEEGDWAAVLAAAGAGDGDYDEWNFDAAAIASLTPWAEAPAGRGRRGGRHVWRPFGADGAATHVQNTFSALGSLTADIEQPLAATPAEHAEVLTGALADAVQQADWAQAEALRAAIRAQRVRTTHSGLHSLLGDSEALLGAVAGEKRTGGRVVEAVVDSGAVHSVTPPGLFPGKVVASPWSRAGRGYRAANGTSIKNLGQVDVPFATAEGHKCRMPLQVAEVEQPLLSVSQLTSAGNFVQLGDTDGHIVNKSTGRTIALERRGGVYIMRMFIPDAAAPLPFGRQGA